MARPDYGLAGFSHPDFVMLGITLSEGGVMVVASSSLTQADIEQHVDRVDVTRLGSPRREYIDGLRWCSIHAEMHDLRIVYGADYAEAFRNLFADWTPEPGPRKRLASSPPEIVAVPKELGR